MRFTKLSDWLNWLETLHPKPIELGLIRIKQVAKRMGLIKPAPFIVTVAGTNGKGSCVALLEAIFLAGNKRVGSYTSPHLIHFNERIKINSQAVTDAELCKAFAYIDDQRLELSLTYFEFCTLAALFIFQQQALDVVVLEVGMGGRLDAVNIIDTDLAIISGIDFDHMDYLGHTREAIGFEKAGIMRSEKLVVYGGDDIPNSILQQARELGATLYYNSRDYSYRINKANWQWQSKMQCLQDIALPNLPIQNVATILQVHELLPAHLQIDCASLKNCVTAASLGGRFQHLTIKNGALLIVDVAHNPQSCTLLAKRLDAEPCQGVTYGLVAMLADKDIKNSLQPLLPVIDHWWLASLDVPRGGKAELLKRHLIELGQNGYQVVESLATAYFRLISQVKPADRIIVFGSFHTVGGVLALHHEERRPC
jgi:dihydrofolate synthase/folylpolyglutamate synthase